MTDLVLVADNEQPSTKKQREGRRSSYVVIIIGSILVASITFGIHQFRIQQDMQEGERKRIADESATMSNSEAGAREREFVREQKDLARVLADSLARNPNDTSLFIPLGTARIASGDTLGAVSIYETYLQRVNPSNLAAQTDYAYLLFITGKTRDGVRLTLNVLKKDPDNQVALYNMAAMSFKENKVSEAIDWMKQCVDADSTTQIAMMARVAIEELGKQRQ